MPTCRYLHCGQVLSVCALSSVVPIWLFTWVLWVMLLVVVHAQPSTSPTQPIPSPKYTNHIVSSLELGFPAWGTTPVFSRSQVPRHASHTLLELSLHLPVPIQPLLEQTFESDCGGTMKCSPPPPNHCHLSHKKSLLKNKVLPTFSTTRDNKAVFFLPSTVNLGTATPHLQDPDLAPGVTAENSCTRIHLKTQT